MKAYSLHDREVGYCQGSGFIVGLLLMQMPEEEAFAVFVKIMQDYKMRDMFKPTMAELGLCMYQLENLVQVWYIFLNKLYKYKKIYTLISVYIASICAYKLLNIVLIFYRITFQNCLYISNLKASILVCTQVVGF